MASAAESRGRVLVFVHVPKTAGTTLRTVLSMNEPGTRSRALGNVFKGGGGVSTSLIERLRSDNGLDLRGVRLLRGHVPLGIREYLPRSLPRNRRPHYFTFLREPADRTLSHYFRIREYGSGYGLPPLPAEPSLDDMLAGGYIHDNLHTRMLSGLPEPFGEVTDEMLEQAKGNLRDGLAFFGLTERFDESLVLARRRLGLRTILYRTSGRVNADRPRGEEIPGELREAAERCNRYDIELYAYATELFDSAPEHAEVEFQVEVAALRAAKSDGEVDLADYPPPAGFGGDQEAWRLLLEAHASLMRMEFELARGQRTHRVRKVAARPTPATEVGVEPSGEPEPAEPGERATVTTTTKRRNKRAKPRAKGEGKRPGGKRRSGPKGERKRAGRGQPARKERKPRASLDQATGTESG